MFFISVDQVKKRWKNLKDYKNSKEKAGLKKAKETTGSGRMSDDAHENENDDDNNIVTDTNDEDLSFLNECSTQRETIGSVNDTELFDVHEVEFNATNVDTATQMVFLEQGDVIASGSGLSESIIIEDDFDMESVSMVSQQSSFPLTAKTNKRKRQPKEDAVVAIMQEKTNALRELVNTSSAMAAAYNHESNEKSITQRYFDLYSSEIAMLPTELQAKCQREVQQAMTAIIHKFQDQAEELKKAAEQ